MIRGTPTSDSPETVYTITATNPGGSSTFALTLTVGATPTKKPDITGYTLTTATYSTYNVITDNVPTLDMTAGDAASSWTIAPSLSAGLSIDASTGTISGNPTSAAATATYTISATNVGGVDTIVVTITVEETISDPPVLGAYTHGTSSYAVDVAIAQNSLSSIGGGAPSSFQVSPPLPTGLSIHATLGQITGTPTQVQTEATYTITAKNVAGTSNTVSVVIVVADVTAPVFSGGSPTVLEAYETEIYVQTHLSEVGVVFAMALTRDQSPAPTSAEVVSGSFTSVLATFTSAVSVVGGPTVAWSILNMATNCQLDVYWVGRDAAMNDMNTPVLQQVACAQDSVTLAPIIGSPLSNMVNGPFLIVTYTLPEQADAGSLQITLTHSEGGGTGVGRLATIVPVASFLSAGTHTFSVDVSRANGASSDAASSKLFASVVGLPLLDGATYTTRIQYVYEDGRERWSRKEERSRRGGVTREIDRRKKRQRCDQKRTISMRCAHSY